jgi:Flp pilus assembly protein TadD
LLLQHERGDLEGAEAAYRRGVERGVADAAHNLGVLLQQRGDLEGAKAAWRRARRRALGEGNEEVAEAARLALRGLGGW